MKRGIIFRKIYDILDFFRKEENEVNNFILKELKAPELDEIRKKELIFPEVLFPMKTAPVEWWYFTGHLKSKEKRYGFEYCIFKFHPKDFRIGPLPLYLFKREPYLVLHSALTDKNSGKFINYNENGLINKEEIDYDRLDLKLGNSELIFNENFRIKGKMMNLELHPLKKLIKHFDGGFTKMYKKPESRTYYVSFPRLETRGEIYVRGKKIEVHGTAWFDHQKSNLTRGSPVKGWDWLSIQLEDNTEIMIFIIRDNKGLRKEFMGGSYITKDSKLIKIRPEDIEIEVLEEWKSEKTGIEYPSRWKLIIKSIKTELDIKPCVKNQEINLGLNSPTSYWEGACDVKGTKNGKKIKGQGYAELVGYDKRFIAEVFRKSMD